MTIFIQNFVIALPLFLIFDFMWLGLLMNSFYMSQLGSLARKVGDSFSSNWIATSIAYLILVFGLVMLVTSRAYASDSVGQAIITGAIFGLVVYGIYNMFNLSVFKDWPIRMTIIDILWGIFLCATVSGLTVYLARIFFK